MVKHHDSRKHRRISVCGNTVKLIAAVVCVASLQACRSTESVENTAGQAAYVCQQAASPIAVDGKLDESAWDTAEVISTFYPYTPTTEPALSPTRVRMLWDSNYLYVGFECDDDDVWSCSTQDDTDLWSGDVAEFFIQADTDGRSFYEFVAAPSGALSDALHASKGGGGFRRFGAWSSGTKVATTVRGTEGDWRDNDQGYTVEMAIPLKAIDGELPTTLSNAWTFGAFRYNYSKSFDEAQLLMSIPESPKWGFHYYPAYRPVVFEAKK
jgi:Carbohydrate family 9 binding domain-like